MTSPHSPALYMVPHAPHVLTQPSAERVMYVDPIRPDVLMEPSRDGMSYRRICGRHQTVSLPVTRIADLEAVPCPDCYVELERRDARARFVALHADPITVRSVGSL